MSRDKQHIRGITLFLLGFIVLMVWKNSRPLPDPVEYLVKNQNTNPCDALAAMDTVFNGIYLGMPKSAYTFKTEFVDYKSQSMSGSIVWTPEWKSDTLIGLDLQFEADQNYIIINSETPQVQNKKLALDVWRTLYESKKNNCENKSTDGRFVLICGRTIYEYVPGGLHIRIYDGCIKLREMQQKIAEENQKMDDSKKLFN